MRVIHYRRVSTAGQAEEGVSLDAQEAKARAWAEISEAEEVIVFTDAGISGKKADNRPGLQDALSECRRGDVLLVYSLSRLARSTKDTIEIAETLERKGADLVSLSEKIDTTTAAGKMVFRMLAVLSEFERDQVSERTTAALAHKWSRREKLGGDVPFGYVLEADGSLSEERKEQDAIRLMQELRGGGHSLRAIGRELEARGVSTKQGRNHWHPQQVSAILKREAA
jgi:site-specific DNA recombinase